MSDDDGIEFAVTPETRHEVTPAVSG